ncbi:MAG: acyltransferase family protein, partial [Actinomycetota bacterium]
VVLHAAITYMEFAPDWWYVVDSRRSLLFTAIVLLIDVPLMPALFFVAGYFALPSLQRRGPGGFVREKIVRLGIPWVIGVVFLAPPAAYMIYVSRDVPMGYLEFWKTDFWGPMFQQSVYWFLGVLFFGFLLVAWMWGSQPEPVRAREPRPETPGAWVFAAVVAGTAAWAMVEAPVAGLDDWRHVGWLFVIQPARLAFYAGYFLLGIYAERRAWFGGAGYRPELGPWGWGSVIAGIVYLGYRWEGNPTTYGERAVAAVLFATFCLTALIAGIAVFQRVADGTGRAWRHLASNAYGVYYVHPLILYPLAYAIRDFGAPPIVKVTILIVVTLGASVAVSALVLRRLPGLRRVF